MFNIGLSEILVVALVSLIALDKSQIPVFLSLIKKMYRDFTIMKLRIREFLYDVGIEELCEQCDIEKVNYIVSEDQKLYHAYNIDNLKKEEHDSKDSGSR